VTRRSEAIHLQAMASHPGGGARSSRHNLRERELNPRSGAGIIAASRTEGERLVTRNIPDAFFREDEGIARLAGALFDWKSDKYHAEERLAEAHKRGRVRRKDGHPMRFRSEEERARERLALRPHDAGAVSWGETEKRVISVRAYTHNREAEEISRPYRGRGKKGTGFLFIFSSDIPLDNREFVRLGERFLTEPIRVDFREKGGLQDVVNPLRNHASVFVIHRRDHAHLWVEKRDHEGRAATFGYRVWRSLDEHWARIWSEHLGDPRLLEVHQSKKAEQEEFKRQIRAWNLETQARMERGLPPIGPPPDKPHRVADERDQDALKIASQIKTDLETLGLEPSDHIIEIKLDRARSNDETRRAMIEAEVAEERFKTLLVKGAERAEVEASGDEADALRARSDAINEARAAKGKGLPLALYRTDR
jgi:hypothetical protein